MFKRCKNLYLVSLALILLSFLPISASNAEEFADGKYFASVYDSYNVRWHIIVEKSVPGISTHNGQKTKEKGQFVTVWNHMVNVPIKYPSSKKNDENGVGNRIFKKLNAYHKKGSHN